LTHGLFPESLWCTARYHAGRVEEPRITRTRLTTTIRLLPDTGVDPKPPVATGRYLLLRVRPSTSRLKRVWREGVGRSQRR
jgi:hypothetical protein